nr:hypothetical protein CFP56_21566 [Quercus suber]
MPNVRKTFDNEVADPMVEFRFVIFERFDLTLEGDLTKRVMLRERISRQKDKDAALTYTWKMIDKIVVSASCSIILSSKAQDQVRVDCVQYIRNSESADLVPE